VQKWVICTSILHVGESCVLVMFLIFSHLNGPRPQVTCAVAYVRPPHNAFRLVHSVAVYLFLITAIVKLITTVVLATNTGMATVLKTFADGQKT